MGLTAKINCPDTSRELDLPTLNNELGRHLLDIWVGDPVYDIRRFHPPGTDGNSIIRCGIMDRRIGIKIRYIGTKADILSDIEQDKSEWAGHSVNIWDAGGISYYSCNLVPNSARPASLIKPMGPTQATGAEIAHPESPDDIVCFVDFSYEFQNDGGE